MNWKRNRLENSEQIQRQWQKLTNEDLDAIDGNRETLRQKLQDRYGYTSVEVDEELMAFENPFVDKDMDFNERLAGSKKNSRNTNNEQKKVNLDLENHGSGMDQGQTNHRR